MFAMFHLDSTCHASQLGVPLRCLSVRAASLVCVRSRFPCPRAVKQNWGKDRMRFEMRSFSKPPPAPLGLVHFKTGRVRAQKRAVDNKSETAALCAD